MCDVKSQRSVTQPAPGGSAAGGTEKLAVGVSRSAAERLALLFFTASVLAEPSSM